jgi:hypothetical protein
MSVSDKANAVLQVVEKKTLTIFGNRAISLFKLGSLGNRGDFSLCSDVDVALLLDKFVADDEEKIKNLWDEIKASQLDYADRFSLYWSSYHGEDFNQGRGRFPALDRLDLLRHGLLIQGVDCRTELTTPKPEMIVIESGKFILSFMLAGEKCDELIKHADVIMKKGTRYFTKFVLFPVRLVFTLDNQGVIGSNRDAVEYFKQRRSKQLPSMAIELVIATNKLRNEKPNSPVMLDNDFVNQGLLVLYTHCVEQYCKAALSLDEKELAQQLHTAMKKITTKKLL